MDVRAFGPAACRRRILIWSTVGNVPAPGIHSRSKGRAGRCYRFDEEIANPSATEYPGSEKSCQTLRRSVDGTLGYDHGLRPAFNRCPSLEGTGERNCESRREF